MTIWLLAIDLDCCTYKELKYRKVIAQGWADIGDLSPLLTKEDQKTPLLHGKNKDKFRKIISAYVTYVYGQDDKRDPGRIMLNLLSMNKGDYVICCEGETVKGIAKLSNDIKYDYQNPSLYEYAQAIYPVTDWKDIKSNDHGIKLSAMGPVGILKYGGNVDIPKLYESYN
jgi:hypothetical protein